MQIFWHGLTCVRIEAKHGDQDAMLVTDPYGSESGLRFPRTLAPDVVALSHQEEKRFPLDAFTNTPFVISHPGEYEVKGIFFYTSPFASEEEARGPHGLIHRFEIEGMAVGFLGGATRILSNTELERLGSVDILLLPVGGGSRIVAKQAMEVISAIEPRIVVPLGFHVEGIKEKLGSVDAFCRELGVCKRQNANRLKIVKKDLPAEDLLVYVLERA